MNIVEAVISVLCAIYTRVSTDDQVHSVFGSLEKQFEMCRKHLAGERGWVHHATYSDPAVSGKEWDRDGLQELLRAVAEGTLKMVIVYHSSRLSRVLVDTIRILEHFAKHGCGLYSLGEGFIDISTPEARLNAAQRAAQNEYQHGQIVKSVREGVVMKVASGYWQCGWAPWGFLRDLPNCTIVQDPETAPLVREVFERTAAGECFGDIAADLNARGIRTPKRRHSKKAEGVGGHEFDTDYLWAVIQNVAYKGFGRTRYIQARHIPAPVYIDAEGMAVYKGNHYAVRIVDEDLWDRANTKAAANKRRFYSANAFKRLGDSPLMGFIKCGHCSGAMSPTYSLKKTKTGINRHRYYACQNVVQNGKQCECDVRRISAPLIESIVMQGMGPIGWHPDVITLLGPAPGSSH
jgi:DNA invertase Pin-like site-specific DNA recombinase